MIKTFESLNNKTKEISNLYEYKKKDGGKHNER